MNKISHLSDKGDPTLEFDFEFSKLKLSCLNDKFRTVNNFFFNESLFSSTGAQ